jgi:hypothetical protein
MIPLNGEFCRKTPWHMAKLAKGNYMQYMGYDHVYIDIILIMIICFRDEIVWL